jgi:hypothetical protein
MILEPDKTSRVPQRIQHNYWMIILHALMSGIWENSLCQKAFILRSRAARVGSGDSTSEMPIFRLQYHGRCVLASNKKPFTVNPSHLKNKIIKS